MTLSPDWNQDDKESVPNDLPLSHEAEFVRCKLWSCDPFKYLINNQTLTIIEAHIHFMTKDYFWSFQEPQLKLNHINDQGSLSSILIEFKTGIDCLEDVWVLVHAILNLPDALKPFIVAKVEDRDGEVLFFEIRDLLPKHLAYDQSLVQTLLYKGRPLILSSNHTTESFVCDFEERIQSSTDLTSKHMEKRIWRTARELSNQIMHRVRLTLPVYVWTFIHNNPKMIMPALHMLYTTGRSNIIFDKITENNIKITTTIKMPRPGFAMLACRSPSSTNSKLTMAESLGQEVAIGVQLLLQANGIQINPLASIPPVCNEPEDKISWLEDDDGSFNSDNSDNSFMNSNSDDSYETLSSSSIDEEFEVLETLKHDPDLLMKLLEAEQGDNSDLVSQTDLLDKLVKLDLKKENTRFQSMTRKKGIADLSTAAKAEYDMLKQKNDKFYENDDLEEEEEKKDFFANDEDLNQSSSSEEEIDIYAPFEVRSIPNRKDYTVVYSDEDIEK